MAKKKRRNGNNITGTAMKFIRLGALLGPGIGAMTGPGDMNHKVAVALYRYTGYNIENNTFDVSRLGQGWMPYISAVLVTRGVQKISGIIRKI